MPGVLEIREVCERALRKIGAYSINDDGARAREMDEARRWLDLIVGHVVSRRRCWWLVPETATLALVPGQTEYDLSAYLPGSPEVQHAITVAWIEIASGRRGAMELARREDWEARQPRNAGRPEMVYVDRTSRPTLRVHPAPPAPVTHNLLVTFQRFSDDMREGASTRHIPGMRETWNLYLITALAYELGNGPVRKLPADEVAEMRAAAVSYLADLEAYDAHEQASEPRRTTFHDF